MPIEINNSGNDNTTPVTTPAASQVPQETTTPPIQPTPAVTIEPSTLGDDTTIITSPVNPTDQQTLNGDVQISDQAAPLVVLFGPTSCGKTMTLIRLTKYLRNKGYAITPDGAFRPAYDTDYQNDCAKFDLTVNNPIAAPGTSGYMLVDVIGNGQVLCKILEAPGEYYFDPNNPQQQYPHYLNKIINAPNRKVWCAFVEPNWESATARSNYVTRIANLKPVMKSTDKMVFVFNKIDKLMHLIKAPGVVNEKLAIKHVSDNYPRIFERFACEIPIVKWFRPYDCSFVPFQTGTFTQDTASLTNQVLYAEGDDAYPARLWKIISKSI